MERMRENDYTSRQYLFIEGHKISLAPELSKKSEKLKDKEIRKIAKGSKFLDEICQHAPKTAGIKWDFGIHGDDRLINTQGNYFTICYYRKVGTK